MLCEIDIFPNNGAPRPQSKVVVCKMKRITFCSKRNAEYDTGID